MASAHTGAHSGIGHSSVAHGGAHTAHISHAQSHPAHTMSQTNNHLAYSNDVHGSHGDAALIIAPITNARLPTISATEDEYNRNPPWRIPVGALNDGFLRPPTNVRNKEPWHHCAYHACCFQFQEEAVRGGTAFHIRGPEHLPICHNQCWRKARDVWGKKADDGSWHIGRWMPACHRVCYFACLSNAARGPHAGKAVPRMRSLTEVARVPRVAHCIRGTWEWMRWWWRLGKLLGQSDVELELGQVGEILEDP